MQSKVNSNSNHFRMADPLSIKCVGSDFSLIEILLQKQRDTSVTGIEPSILGYDARHLIR